MKITDNISTRLNKKDINTRSSPVTGGEHDTNAIYSQPTVCNSFKIGYFADGIWGQNCLKMFVKDPIITVKFLVPRYQAPDDRLVQLAREYDIEILMHKNINSNDFIEKINVYHCDLYVSMSFDQIFRNEIINLPPYKTINCHAGKLPFYRGRNILNWALINDEKEFGITAHYVDEGIDTGDILIQRCYEIRDEDNYDTLLKKAQIECPEILYEAVKRIQTNKAQTIRQSSIHPLGFYCVKREKGDELIDWNMNSRDVFNFIRAICPPGPSACSYLKGKMIKIHKATYLPDAPNYKGIPGSIVQKDKQCLYVKTRDSFVRIESWDYDGMILIGDRLKSHE